MEHCSGDIQETDQGLKLTDKSIVQHNTVGKVVQCSSDSNLDILTLKFLFKYECLYSYKSNKKISQTRLKKPQSAAKNPFFPHHVCTEPNGEILVCHSGFQIQLECRE